MRRGGGKQKGGAYERVICKKLSLWVSRGKRTDLFWRSAMSGGRATVARKKGIRVDQCGDICAVHPDGHVLTNEFLIECKHYRNLDIAGFIIKYTGPLAKFWKRAVKDAIAHDRKPMLIVKQNNYPDLVLVTDDCWFDRELCMLTSTQECDIYLLSHVLAQAPPR